MAHQDLLSDFVSVDSCDSLSSNPNDKRNKNKLLSSGSKFDCNGTDIYRMCKKIAQLTKVIYNLNVKNDELETYHSQVQREYEKKMWKLSADVQQYATNAAANLRSEMAQSAELSQLRTHLEEQMVGSERLSEELAQANHQHADELEAARMDAERRLEAQRTELTAAVAARHAQLETARRQLTAAADQLAESRAERAVVQERAAGLQSRLEAAERRTDEALRRLEDERGRGRRYVAENERRAETEAELRRNLTIQASEHQQEVEQLRAHLANQKKELVEHTNQLAADRGREEELNGCIMALTRERDQLTSNLAEVRSEVQQRDRLLQERDTELRGQATLAQELEAGIEKMAVQMRSCSEEVRTSQAQLEGAQLEVQKKTAELGRALGQQQRLQAESASSRTRTDQLSQLLLARDSEICRLEAQLEETTSTSTAPSPAPTAPEDVVALRVELEEAREKLLQSAPEDVVALWAELGKAREKLLQSERRREDQANLLQAALEESADMEVDLRRQVEQLETVTSEREQQLMEDAETRLREVQRDCKRRLDEQQLAAEERVKTARHSVETELQVHIQAVNERAAIADQKLQEAEVLRSFEAEVVQLRGLTHELMRELRVGNRQTELARTQEARAAEENRRLSELLNKHNAAVANTQKEQQLLRQKWDEQLQLQLERCRATLAAEWEDRLREERSRLKAELDCLHGEEKHLAVESMRLGREQQLQEAELRARQLQQQLASVHQELQQMQTSHHCELDRRQGEAETVICDMRAQLELLRENLAEKAHGEQCDDADDSGDDGGGGGGGDTDGVADRQRRQIERQLRDRPDLRGALADMLAERDSRVALAQHELRLARELRECEHNEHRTEVSDLRDQLAARDRLTDKLMANLGETRRDLDQAMQRITVQDHKNQSQIQAVLSKSLHHGDALEQKHRLELELMRSESQSAAQLAVEKIKELETLVEEAQTQPRPQDRDAMSQLRRALEERDSQLEAARRDRQQLALELTNRDASYSRLFSAAPRRVGVLDPTAPPSRPQRRGPARAAKH